MYVDNCEEERKKKAQERRGLGATQDARLAQKRWLLYRLEVAN